MKQRIRIGLCLMLLLTTSLACAPSPGQVAPAPAQPDIKPEEWAARYPTEYNDWKGSVHGAAYLAGDSDAPGCTSCHPDPASGEIQTSAFRLDIPTRCASCHADKAKMARHNLPADTYATYVADDYHGKTIAYYRNHETAMWRYEAVCSDCHRSHAVYGPDDPRSSVAQANLLTTCQKCHLGAAPHFVDFASGHFRTALARSPLVYYASLVYRILIPLVVGLMVAYIALDIVHRLRLRRRPREEAHG